MSAAVIILVLVLIAIALRKSFDLSIPIWLTMTIGAVLALVFHQITISGAITAINYDVMLYLLGVFIISQAAEMSGYLGMLTDRLFFRAKTGNQVLLIIVFVLGLSSALLMNDTIAIVGTPIILQLCKYNKKLVKPLLLGLAYAITVGSVLSPIGNPQNLLIAVKGSMATPFIDFIKLLAIPTLITLIIVYLFVYIFYRSALIQPLEKSVSKTALDHKTIVLIKLSLAIMLVLLIGKIMTETIMPRFRFNFSFIAILSALPILIFSRNRSEILKSIDWRTLIFFISMFVLMQSVWNSGLFQVSILRSHVNLTDTSTILLISIILSQFISNVPLVALYLPPILDHGASNGNLLALAAGSTIAGNLSILGAASNVIIIQNAEKHRMACFGFFEFMKIGIPLTLISVLVYFLFL